MILMLGSIFSLGIPSEHSFVSCFRSNVSLPESESARYSIHLKKSITWSLILFLRCMEYLADLDSG